jgi:hypothetical protein
MFCGITCHKFFMIKRLWKKRSKNERNTTLPLLKWIPTKKLMSGPTTEKRSNWLSNSGLKRDFTNVSKAKITIKIVLKKVKEACGFMVAFFEFWAIIASKGKDYAKMRQKLKDCNG